MTHTGIRAAYAATAQAYVGKEASFDAARTLVDLVATYNVTESQS